MRSSPIDERAFRRAGGRAVAVRDARSVSSPPRASRSQVGRPLRSRQRRIRHGRAESRRAGPRRRASGVESGVVVGGGCRQPPRIDHALGEARVPRERQGGVAEASLLRRARGDEVRRAGRVADVLVRCRGAFDVVAVDQRPRAPRRTGRARASRRGSPRPACRNCRRGRRRAKPGGRHRRRRSRAHARSARAGGIGRCRPTPIRG